MGMGRRTDRALYDRGQNMKFIFYKGIKIAVLGNIGGRVYQLAPLHSKTVLGLTIRAKSISDIIRIIDEVLL